jgi:N-acetylmuramoyl-L-alanine amidase
MFLRAGRTLAKVAECGKSSGNFALDCQSLARKKTGWMCFQCRHGDCCTIGMRSYTPSRLRSRLPLVLLLAVAVFACTPSAESVDQSEDDVRGGTGTQVVTVAVATRIKTSTADSSTLSPSDRCSIAVGTKLSLESATPVGSHVRAKLISAVDCGAKFIPGSTVYLYRAHFSGWATVNSPMTPSIVDDVDNYAESCHYREANRGVGDITRIVLHNTEGSWAGVKGKYQAKECSDGVGAAHYLIRRDGTILRTIAERHIAFHATVANSDSIGIEIEASPSMPGMVPAQERSVVALTKSLQDKYSISTARVLMHRLAAPGSTDCAHSIWPIGSDSAFYTWRDKML